MGERAGIWLRVSSGGQDEANQEPDVTRYCEARGYEIVPDCRYVIHAKSAFHGKHQADLDRALADVRAGKIAVLVIWHSDRIERRPGKALLDVLAEFTAAGGRVESVQEPSLGALDFGGQVTTFIAGLVNHEKVAHLRQQVGLAHDRSRENGALVGRPPFGYTTAGEKYHRRLVPTDVGRKYVPGVFTRIAAGETLSAVALWLTAEGVPTPQKGAGWSRNRIATLIRNPAYMGRRCEWDTRTRKYGRTLHKCEALVDAAEWRRANDSLDARPGRGKRPSTVNPEALLKSLLRCPRCDGPMYRLFTRDGAFYRCTGKGAIPRSSCRNMVKCADLDALVSDFMASLTDEITRTVLVRGSNHDAEIAAVKDEMRDLAARDLPDAEYDRELRRLRRERDRLMALPATPDRWEQVSTGETYAARWERLEPSERGAWLRSASRGLRVWAIRADSAPDRVRLGERELTPGVTLPSRSGLPGKHTVVVAHGAWAVIAWNIESL